ncbi:glycosyltransferase involved in cell wall biosynthesis [Nitrobacteraceae bacterium AZCC 1564]
MPMTKVVHVISGLRRGGAETMLAKLLEVMDRNRFQQTVIVLEDKGVMGQRIEQAGVPVIALNMAGVLDFPRVLLRIRSILKKEKPNVVQTWLYHADLMGTLAAKAAGNARLIWNLRCSDMNFSDYNPMMQLICRLLARLSSVPELVISNSLTGQKVHSKLGYHPRAWRLLPNGFDTERFRPNAQRAAAFRNSLGVVPSTPLIGLPARLDPMKDQGNFLAAAAMLVQDHPQARFALIGRGLTPDNAAIVSQIAAQGLEGRVHLLGERDDMEIVMAGLDIVTLCSAYGEGFPNVLGEALSCGVLCVATDVGDASAIVGPYGRIVPPRHPEELAAAWREILALSPVVRQELCSRAREHIISHYSLRAIGQAYEELYSAGA